MPLQTKTFEFDAERERLRDEMNDVAEQQADWDFDTDQGQRLLSRGNELQTFINILGVVDDQWDVDSVELAGLSPGEVNRVADFAESNDGVQERDPWVAVGTHSAPYLEHDPENIRPGDFEATVGVIVDDVPLAYLRWAQSQINELSHLDDGLGNGYLDLVLEKRAEQRSETNG